MLRLFLLSWVLTVLLGPIAQAVPVSSPVLPTLQAIMTPPALPPLHFMPPESIPTYILPAQGVLSSNYGIRWGQMHQGIDIAAPMGTPVLAAAAGTVEFAGWTDGGYGNLIEIRHADGSLTRYTHLSQMQVQKNEQVAQSQLIGEIGSTGYSTGPHLHFEIYLAEQGAVNPMDYVGQDALRLRTAGGSSGQRS